MALANVARYQKRVRLAPVRDGSVCIQVLPNRFVTEVRPVAEVREEVAPLVGPVDDYTKVDLGVEDGPKPVAVVVASLQSYVCDVPPLSFVGFCFLFPVPLVVAGLDIAEQCALRTLGKGDPPAHDNCVQLGRPAPRPAEVVLGDTIGKQRNGARFTEQVVAVAVLAPLLPVAKRDGRGVVRPRSPESGFQVSDHCSMRCCPLTPRQNDLVVVW